MTDERFKDFDDFFDSQGQEPLRVKVFGTTYELPPELPAPLSLRLVRMRMEVTTGSKAEEDEISFDEVEAIAGELFGKDVYAEWCDKGISISQLSSILEWTLEQYHKGLASGEDDEGEAEAPRGAKEGSSNVGRTSKRTSSASTRSTSRTKKTA